ncbi:Pentatricopeptide repeat-containing protein, mitochondrial [Glycine max]|nr:Pentatricopeptide repeat-containing protein, mitochondrial [Glycine max]
MISTYVGSGNMSQAKELFDGMQERNVVSWSTIIAGYVQVGCFMEALGFFHEMLQIGPKPNEYTLVSTLAACSNLVALDKGKWFHAYIGRGDIKMNERLLASIIGIGFAMHGMPNEAIDVFEQMKVEKVSPNKVAFIALLNACSHGYMVEEGNLCFRLMVSDYAITPEIVHYGCMVLSRSGLLKEAEDMISRELLHDIDDEEDRVCFVCTQKLAIAFGLMNTANGTPIRIVKNLRVCGDCHQATKFISKVYNRVIIARDRTRYHRFKDGICSCEDYW